MPKSYITANSTKYVLKTAKYFINDYDIFNFYSTEYISFFRNKEHCLFNRLRILRLNIEFNQHLISDSSFYLYLNNSRWFNLMNVQFFDFHHLSRWHVLYFPVFLEYYFTIRIWSVFSIIYIVFDIRILNQHIMQITFTTSTTIFINNEYQYSLQKVFVIYLFKRKLNIWNLA